MLGRMSRVTGPGRWPENIKPASGQMDGWRLRLSSRGGGDPKAQARAPHFQGWCSEGLSYNTDTKKQIESTPLCPLGYQTQGRLKRGPIWACCTEGSSEVPKGCRGRRNEGGVPFDLERDHRRVTYREDGTMGSVSEL